MKYKQNPDSKALKEIKLENALPIVAYLSAKNPVITIDMIVIGIRRAVGCCFFLSLIFSLLTILFLNTLVLLKYIIRIGKIIIFKINIYGTNSGNPKVNLTKVAKLNPPLMPSQKTKFQNLSLVSQDSWFCRLGNWLIFLKFALISFTRNLKFIICQFIISKLYQTTKQIRAFMLIFSVFICINTDCLANISTNLGTNGKARDDSYSTEQVAELISLAEAKYQIPTGLLTAIAKIESSVRPYALNIGGRSMLHLSKSEAVTIAREKIKQGVTNIDIGVMQLNWRWHGNQFANIEDMLDVSINVGYAAKLLRDLYKQHNDWHKAVRYYHSATGEHHRKYSRKVVLCWLGK